MRKLVVTYGLSVLFVSCDVTAVMSNQHDATRAAACDDFNRATGTVVTGWTEQVGDWAIYTNHLMSESLNEWQYITFNGSNQQNGCVEAIVEYGEGSGVRFMGLTARWIDAGNKIVFKIQDNNNSGYWDSYFLYDAGYNKYHQSGLNLGHEVKIQMEYIGSSITFRIDTDLDGTWDIENTISGFAVTGSGLTGAAAYKQCYLDDWCYGSYCDEPTSTPTRTPTPVNTPTPDCIHHGDVNLDGVISASDAQMAFYIVLGLHVPTYEEECAADCNGDDIVSAADAQAIFLVVLGSGNCVDPL